MCLKIIKQLLLFCLFHCCVVKSNISDVSIELVNSGFHRDLYYSVQLEGIQLDKNCKILLKQDLPSAVYINVDQINDLVRLKKVNAIYPQHVDVELPTELSDPFTVLLKISSELRQNFKLPIHFRYHSPGNQKFVRVELAPPTMFISCKTRNVPLYNSEKQKYCLEENQLIPDTNAITKECTWTQIDFNMHVKSPLRVKIPIGDIGLYQPVTYITIIIGWIGCACILFTANNKIKIIQGKLNKQHSN